MKMIDRNHMAFISRLSKKGEKQEMKNLIEQILHDNNKMAATLERTRVCGKK